MVFSTPVSIPSAPWPIAYSDRLLLLGSCFSDHIADRLHRYFFHVTANPFHTLYNPVSIARHIDEALMNHADVVLVTFGTAWVYLDRHIGTGLEAVVDNCEKRPASDFIRRRLSIEEIVSIWQPVLNQYPNKRFIFTVSPIRHVKDGLHENTLSKSILLLAVERLCGGYYFPSYEILMDELRDYRFYASDMKHPSETAIDYIWERFADTFLTDPVTRQMMQQFYALWQAEHHRPLQPDSPEAKSFALATSNLRNRLHRSYPDLV